MGKYSDFPSQTPQMRPKFAIYTPKRDDGHLRHFYVGVSHPHPPGVRNLISTDKEPGIHVVESRIQECQCNLLHEAE